MVDVSISATAAKATRTDTSLMDTMTRSVCSVWTRPIDAKAIFHSESRDCVENARLTRCWSP